jgi:HSP20 family protein
MSRIDVRRIPESSDRSLPIFVEFDRLADQIRLEAYRMFKHRGAGDGHALDDWLAAEKAVCWPAAELAESDSAYTLKVALAGFDAKDIDVTATPREIIVKASREHRKSGGDGEGELKWSEFGSNDVFKRIEMPSDVDVDGISANLGNGMLEMKVPKIKQKAAAAPARKIKLTTPS